MYIYVSEYLDARYSRHASSSFNAPRIDGALCVAGEGGEKGLLKFGGRKICD